MKISIEGTGATWWFEVWFNGDCRGFGNYTRRSDAVRGVKRFCAAIKKAGKA